MKRTSTISNQDFLIMALSFVDGVGATKAAQLLAHFGTIENIFLATQMDFSHLSFINKKIVDQITQKTTFPKVEEELLFVQKYALNIITFLDPKYPFRLGLMEDKPLVLYSKGDIHPNMHKSIAIVGTRKSTEYAHKFLDEMFDLMKSIPNIITISGLALGVDIKAHKLSCECNIPTIAVMGVALHSIYPAQHARLAQEILDNNGAWITETNSQDYINQGVFPRRNRIIAGMCDAIVVVETGIKGGSMITAQIANELNKDIFALPGKIYDAASLGCNQLIQHNKAIAINTPCDIFEFMNWIDNKSPKVKKIPINFEGTELQSTIIDIIRLFPKINIEQLSEKLNLTTSELAESLVTLELDGIIRTLPGNKYDIS